MKTRLLPRADHDVYFIPFDNMMPNKKEINTYLMANHPYFNHTFSFDCRRCNICGNNFLMLTVIQRSLLKFRNKLFAEKISTASSILASSSFAKTNCIIRCPDEQIVFGKIPASIRPSHGNTISTVSDIQLNSTEEILSLAKKEKINIPLFVSRWRVPAIIGILAASIFLSASLLYQKEVVPPIGIIEEVQIPLPEVYGNFWISFKGELNAVLAAGGTIEKYSYNRALVPSNIVYIAKCDPGKLINELKKNPLLENATIPVITFNSGVYRFSVHYSIKAPLPNLEKQNDAYINIRNFERFCTINEFTLVDIRINGYPEFNLAVSENSLPDFMLKLYGFCTENKLALQSLQLEPVETKNSFSIKLKLTASAETDNSTQLESSSIASAFNLSKKQKMPGAGISIPEKKLVGQILTGNNISIVFTKTDSGKINFREER